VFTTRALNTFPRYPAATSNSTFWVNRVPFLLGSRMNVLRYVLNRPPASCLVDSFLF
jgi:hypothetical protein